MEGRVFIQFWGESWFSFKTIVFWFLSGCGCNQNFTIQDIPHSTLKVLAEKIARHPKVGLDVQQLVEVMLKGQKPKGLAITSGCVSLRGMSAPPKGLVCPKPVNPASSQASDSRHCAEAESPDSEAESINKAQLQIVSAEDLPDARFSSYIIPTRIFIIPTRIFAPPDKFVGIIFV